MIGYSEETKEIKYLDKIQELKDRGFARRSDKLLKYIRKHHLLQIKIFRPGIGTAGGDRSSSKYSSFDIFGDRYSYYYDKERENDFVNFLVYKFLIKNPDPGSGIKAAFTRILHTHGLHWYGCSCVNGNEIRRINSENSTFRRI